MHLQQPLFPIRNKSYIRVIHITIIISVILASIFVVSLSYTKKNALERAQYFQTVQQSTILPPFPIGVHPHNKTITENLDTNTYLQNVLSLNLQKKPRPTKHNLITYIIAKLVELDWYQNLASPTGRIIIIRPGARQEEVTQHISKILHWDTHETRIFTSLVVSTPPKLPDGKFYPANYLVGKDTSPEKMADIIIQRFNSEILARYPSDINRLVSLNDTLTIASLLEREAYNFTDMREISGVIWNRLFIGMNLQIDATLQYAKGTQSTTTWYPTVRPSDKYIKSPFNTYQHKGLPPDPIGSPSAMAVLAALNPTKTKCLFYFHDKNSQFHCSETYNEHVILLKQYYGRGK